MRPFSVVAALWGAYSDAMSPNSPQVPDSAASDECPRCGKEKTLCICEDIEPIDNRISLLILQHPQEQDRSLGTAKLTALHFKDATLKIGLSWPSLAKILGRVVDPQRWAILYLGSVKASDVAPELDVVAVNRKGEAEDDQDDALRYIEGVIVLDGTWSQAKALWWRNPWMLKCRRVVLGPKRPSRYGKLRREPRRDGLSTIEAAGMLLSRLEHKPEIEDRAERKFRAAAGALSRGVALAIRSGRATARFPPAQQARQAARKLKPKLRREVFDARRLVVDIADGRFRRRRRTMFGRTIDIGRVKPASRRSGQIVRHARPPSCIRRASDRTPRTRRDRPAASA